AEHRPGDCDGDQPAADCGTVQGLLSLRPDRERRFSTLWYCPKSQFRTGLPAGGRGIRTLGPPQINDTFETGCPRPNHRAAGPRPTRSSAAGPIGNPAEPRRWMIRAEPRATSAVELLAQRAGRVIQFVTPAPLQFGYDQIDEVSEGFRHHRIGQVEP